MKPYTVALPIVFAAAASSAWTGLGRAQEPSIAASMVQFFVYSDPPDLAVPWQTEGASLYGGSGVIIAGRRILTNAHVVEHAVGIEVKRADASERFPARVTFISHDADLALVEVRDEDFFRGASAVPIGEMPGLQQEVQVWGFPEGGKTLSITSGIVSRIEVDTYAQTGRRLLSTQIDAAINSGNSGGPVLSGDRIVGIAMQTLEEAENVGYMIPTPVIRHFLQDVKDGRYDGVPQLGLRAQNMESESQRLAAGMSPGQSGALVMRVDYGGPAFAALRPHDVLLAIDGHPIANDLTVAWPGIGRVHFSMVYQSRQIGEQVRVLVLRNGRMLTETIVLKAHTSLVPGRRSTERPRYLVFAGLVFQPLSGDYLDYFRDPPPNLLSAAWNHGVTKERREVILMQRVLPDPVNRGYQSWEDEVVRLVNGVPPRDMTHLAELIDQAQGRWLRVLMEDGHLLTVDREAAKAAGERVLDAYGIAEDRYLGLSPSNPARGRKRHR
ncbi:MAG: trypsin-like peptidase domain-containing protein [Polyangiales bacterium]